jgi:hypothetical protein
MYVLKYIFEGHDLYLNTRLLRCYGAWLFLNHTFDKSKILSYFLPFKNWGNERVSESKYDDASALVHCDLQGVIMYWKIIDLWRYE